MRLGDDARAAIESSNLRELSPDVVARLLDDASRVHAPGGSMIHHEGNTSPHLEIECSFIAEIRDSAFATVRQRVARHLLDLASEGQTGPELVAAIGQQDLADAVGSVREVVVRALRQLRERHLIETGRDRIVILDPEGLVAEAYAPVGTPSGEWNQSR